MLLELNVKDESDFEESAERVSSSRCDGVHTYRNVEFIAILKRVLLSALRL